MPEARFWSDALGFVVAEMEAIIAEMPANEDCDAIGSARRDGDIVPDSDFRLVVFEDVVVEASPWISLRGCGMDRKVAYLIWYHYD